MDIFGIVLSICIHENQSTAIGCTSAGLDRRAIPHAIRVCDDINGMPPAYARGIIGGAIIDDDDLGVRKQCS